MSETTVTPYEVFYKQMMNDAYVLSNKKKEKFAYIWDRILSDLCNARFGSQPVVNDILTLAVYYTVQCILDDDLVYYINDYKELFKVRDHLKIIDERIKFNDDVQQLKEDVCMKICQACESLFGQDCEVPALRPNLSSPDQLFYESFVIAMDIFQNYEDFK